MKRIVLLLVCLIVITGMVFSAGGGDKGAAAGKVQKIAINHTSFEESPWEKAAQAFAKNINEKSGGRYDVQTFPAGQLCQGNWQIMLEMVQSGTTPIGIESMTAIATMNPDCSILSLPFLFQDIDHVTRFLSSNNPTWKKFTDQFEKNNIVILSSSPRPMRQLNNNIRIIKTPADIKDMKFRVPANPMFVEIFEAIGAKPVPLPSGEIYTSIQLGTVNGEDNSIQVQYDFKTHEVAKNFTIWNYIADSSNLFINKDFFYSMNAADQAMFREAGKIFTEVNLKQDGEYLVTAMRNMQAAGVTFYTMTEREKDAFKALLAGFYKNYENKYSPADWKAFMDGLKATAK